MSSSPTITVRVSIPLKIDVEAWAANYGTGTDRTAVRDDVRAYAENLVVEQLRDVGVLAPVQS